jgi:beta-mannosidase
MFWQLNDVWPAFSWSAMDWHFEPKPFLNQLSYAYAPFLASGEWNGKEWSLYIINEESALKEVTLHIQYFVKDAVQKDWYQTVQIPEGSSVVFKTKEITHQTDAYFLVECLHPSLPNGKYQRQFKSKGLSNEFMVPSIDNQQWTCTRLFKD